MSTSHSPTENSIALSNDQSIDGPLWEPASIPNATTYWRCTDCARESIRKRDLYRETFHAENCEVHH
jgi:hypothetical protein